MPLQDPSMSATEQHSSESTVDASPSLGGTFLSESSQARPQSGFQERGSELLRLLVAALVSSKSKNVFLTVNAPAISD
jgi:hypothetical protein